MAPTKRLVIIGIVYAFSAIFFVTFDLTTDQLEAGPDIPDNPTNDTTGTFGFFDTLGAIINTVFDFLEVVWDVATANFPGAPVMVRIAWAIGMNVTIVWDTVALFRGGQ